MLGSKSLLNAKGDSWFCLHTFELLVGNVCFRNSLASLNLVSVDDRSSKSRGSKDGGINCGEKLQLCLKVASHS